MNRLHTDAIFDSGSLNDDLSRKTVRGGVVTMSSQAALFAIRTGGTMVLARLLTPGDYGLIGMAVVVLNFAAMFKDAGLSMATVQQDRITHEQVSTLFWVNALISSVLGLCVVAVAPLVARFYGRPELAAVTAVLSLSIVIGGLMIQHQALLRRHMMFRTLALIEVTSQSLNFGGAILLAYLGWRYWALVGGTIIAAFASTILTILFCSWRPSRMYRGVGVRNMLRFGGYLTGFNVMNYFSRNMDNILIGRVLGAEALGYYGRAYNLMMQPLSQVNPPITTVAVPMLSRLKDSPDDYRRAYTRILSGLTWLTVPLIVFLAVYVREVVTVVLGSQWLSVVPIFTALAVAGLVQPASNTTGWLYTSQGRTKEMFNWGVFASITTVASFAAGLPWGSLGVATAYVIGVLVRQPILVWHVTRSGPVRARDYYRALAGPAVLAVSLLVTLFFTRAALEHANMPMRIAGGLLVAVVVTLGVAAMSPASRQNVRTLVRAVRRTSDG